MEKNYRGGQGPPWAVVKKKGERRTRIVSTVNVE
jgi:hypothetical protein